MRAYSVNLSAQSLTAAATSIFEITAGATISIIITRWALAQQSNTTSAQQGIQIARQSTSGTSVATPNINPDDVGDAAASLTAKGLCTAQGTIGALLYPDAFNWQNPYLYLPVPEERIAANGAAILGFRTLTTPPALTISSTVGVLEVG